MATQKIRFQYFNKDLYTSQTRFLFSHDYTYRANQYIIHFKRYIIHFK